MKYFMKFHEKNVMEKISWKKSVPWNSEFSRNFVNSWNFMKSDFDRVGRDRTQYLSVTSPTLYLHLYLGRQYIHSRHGVMIRFAFRITFSFSPWPTVCLHTDPIASLTIKQPNLYCFIAFRNWDDRVHIFRFL
jgi:hypothetical protein